MPAFFSDDLPVLQENAGVAPPFPHALWKKISESQLGIAVKDPDGHDIGMGAAKRSFGPFSVPGYTPVDGKKHTLVGEVDRYAFFNPAGSGAEADFNILIAPDPAYMYILDDVVVKMTKKEREDLHARTRGPSGFCVECEITPDEAYYSNPWFPNNNDRKSPLVGKKLGLYGPWVGDGGHSRRPEIHPCEVIWWKRRSGAIFGVKHDEWRILVLQDDSNRFDRSGDYEAPGAKRPWSAVPRRAEIVLALEVPRGKTTTFTLDIARGRHEHEHPNELRNISRSLPDNTTVIVSKEKMSRHGRIKARLSHTIGEDPANGFLRLFLHLYVQVGIGDRGDEGFAEIVVSSTAVGTPFTRVVTSNRRIGADTPAVAPTEQPTTAQPGGGR
ncbi:hypothetical protein OUO20_05525 [Arthrobacter sp. FX8]|uniref:hypothetical protein n=1 Tax=Arthrobacter sp. FX8 TaxID=2997335 RepID=UPI00227A7C2A|nr:hypothetical protein [Arthrobacter sp. FX8]WAJ34395.1 hypothetical protein OUO20_05525 [Arthrobacter sp. FX8]